jgi:hypothetical protein
MDSSPEIAVRQGNILDIDCDVIALKYAQKFYGADAAVVKRLVTSGIDPETLCPPAGSHLLIQSKGSVPAREILFVGLPAITSFSYQDVRRLGSSVLRILKRERPLTESLAMTVHGRGFGLDEIECVQQQLLGYGDACSLGECPDRLKRILIIEQDPNRVEAIDQIISKFFKPDANARSTQRQATREADGSRWYRFQQPPPNDPKIVEPEKTSIFVAMPFGPEMRDVWTFGIQQAVRKLGLNCERLDEAAFLGDIMAQVKTRIQKASFVIADLSGSNANVFLEVGYAWGIGRNTILLLRKSKTRRDHQGLPFDVSGQRCIVYEDATHLQEQLSNELIKLGLASAPLPSRR